MGLTLEQAKERHAALLAALRAHEEQKAGMVADLLRLEGAISVLSEVEAAERAPDGEAEAEIEISPALDV